MRTILLAACLFGWSALAHAGTELTERWVIDRIRNEGRRAKIVRVEAELRANEVERARATFDPQLSFAAGHRIDSSEKVVPVFGTENTSTHFLGAVETTLPSGTLARVGYDTTRMTSNSTFATVDPSFEGAWFAAIRQPLLRDAFGSSLRASVRLAETNARSAALAAEAETDAAVLAGARLYWGWIWARDQGAVAEEAVFWAREFLKVAGRRLTMGIAETSDRFAAEANLSARVQELETARVYEQNTATRLKNFLLLAPEDLLVPGKEEREASTPEPLPVLVERSLSGRKDVVAARTDLQAKQTQLEISVSGARPKFDLVSTLRLNAIDDDWSEAVGSSVSSDHPDWFVGGEFTIPWSNRALRSDVRRSELEKRHAELILAELEDHARTETRVARDTVVSMRAQLERAIEGLQWEKKKTDAAEADFRRSRTSAMVVLQYQVDRLRAERQANLIRIEVRLADASLRHATGDL